MSTRGRVRSPEHPGIKANAEHPTSNIQRRVGRRAKRLTPNAQRSTSNSETDIVLETVIRSLFPVSNFSNERFETWIAPQIIEHWINFYGKKVVGLTLCVGTLQLLDGTVFVTQSCLNQR